MLFLIAQIKRFGTLNATQKTAALYDAPFLKKSGKNCLKIVKIAFFAKNGQFLSVFPDFFKEPCFAEGCGFLHCVQCPKTLNLSFKKQHLELFSNFSP
jgi:hypothetical protein